MPAGNDGGARLVFRPPFEQLAAIIDGVQEPERLGVCVDTCHIFAAGYPIGTEKDYQGDDAGTR